MKIKTRPILIVVMLFCLAAPKAFGVVPAPDGCYPGFTTAEGCSALNNLGSGAGNSGFGWYSLFSNTNGSYNTGIGAGTLVLNNGGLNTAIGTAALLLNTTGIANTATGTLALIYNNDGNNNTAVGTAALYHHTTGDNNNAFGANALGSDQSGAFNNAFGEEALAFNIDGFANTAMGDFTLSQNEHGSGNTAVGAGALVQNRADGNTAVGLGALTFNSNGYNNTAVGSNALGNNDSSGKGVANYNNAFGNYALIVNVDGYANNAFGDSALKNCVNCNSNTAIGDSAGAAITGSGNVCIGAGVIAAAAHDNRTWIRNVYGDMATDRIVYVDSDGHLGTLSSSRRYKEDIKPMCQASEALYDLKPVTFRYKKQVDPLQAPSFGLIAEEVADVNPDLVVRDQEGKPYSVRYDQVNAMLLNEFLKEHRKIEEQQVTIRQQRKAFEAEISQLKKEMGTLAARLNEQNAEIQTVRAQIEMNKSAPRVAANEP